MFDWLTRLMGRQQDTTQQDMARARAARAARRSKSKSREAHAEPAPLPEVVGEGNSHADWSEWEDSMNALDSQMGGFVHSQRVYERDDEERYTRPGKLTKLRGEPDAFGNINKNRDI
jgi:hypothetical protein